MVIYANKQWHFLNYAGFSLLLKHLAANFNNELYGYLEDSKQNSSEMSKYVRHTLLNSSNHLVYTSVVITYIIPVGLFTAKDTTSV